MGWRQQRSLGISPQAASGAGANGGCTEQAAKGPRLGCFGTPFSRTCQSNTQQEEPGQRTSKQEELASAAARTAEIKAACSCRARDSRGAPPRTSACPPSPH